MEKQVLTPKQQRVLVFIRHYFEQNGYSPSLREISKFLGKSLSTAQHFVEELQARGHLHKEESIARGITTTDEQSGRIFKLGFIAAGKPIEPTENPEPIDVPISMLQPRGDYYALGVKGTSMMEDGILDGDTIIVKHQRTANDGNRIVAITENGATLKVFRNRSGRVYLEPRNKLLRPIYPKELEVRGKFVGLIRAA